MPPKKNKGGNHQGGSTPKASKICKDPVDPNVTITDGDSSNADMDVSNTTSADDIYNTPEKDTGRQPTPQRGTPCTTDVDTPFSDSNPIIIQAGNLGEKDKNVSDESKVSEAVKLAGGLIYQNKPDPANQKAGKGQELKVNTGKFTADEFDLAEPVPVRPDATTLRRITEEELRPPPSSMLVPLEPTYNLPDFVTDQRIEFLIVVRSESAPEDAWGFPTEEVFQKMYNSVRDEHEDHPQIFDVALWHRIDKNGIASIMLSTCNLPLMTAIRHSIRIYKGHHGFAFESYNKRKFIKRYGISLYVPKENAGYKFRTIGRTLFCKYPDLKSDLEIMSEITFTDNLPDWTPNRRSRIGDKIYLLDSPDLARKLQKYPEEFKFHLSEGFSVTLRGGIRGEEITTQFANSFASKVMLTSSAEALKNAKSYSNEGP